MRKKMNIFNWHVSSVHWFNIELRHVNQIITIFFSLSHQWFSSKYWYLLNFIKNWCENIEIDCKCLYLLSSKGDGVAVFFGEVVSGRWNIVKIALDFFANQFFTQEFTAFKHPRDIVQWTEVFRSRGEFTFIVGGTKSIPSTKIY